MKTSTPRQHAAHWVNHTLSSITFAIGLTLMLNSAVGLSPYDMLATRSAEMSGYSVAWTLFILGTIIAIAAWALGFRPRAGTISNYVLVSVIVGVTMPILPHPTGGAAVAQAIAGSAIMALSVGFIVASAHVGVGPYSQLVLAVTKKTGWRLWQTQLAVDATVLTVALILGARLGWGTLIICSAFPLLMPLGNRAARNLLPAVGV